MQRGQCLSHFIDHGDRVRIGLTIDVDERCRMSVGRHHRVLRLDSIGHGRDVRNRHWGIVDGRDDDVVELIRFFCLAADQCEFELVILFNQSGRDDDVRCLDRISYLLNRNVVRGEPFGIDHHVKLARLSAGYADDRHPR